VNYAPFHERFGLALDVVPTGNPDLISAAMEYIRLEAATDDADVLTFRHLNARARGDHDDAQRCREIAKRDFPGLRLSPTYGDENAQAKLVLRIARIALGRSIGALSARERIQIDALAD
jgi:hypothetical protein